MPLPSDDIFGVLYLSPDDFIARARAFGVSVAGMTPDELTPTIAAASRLVDAKVARQFLPDAIVETHRFNMETRRVSVNQPPVMALESFAIRFAPGAVANFQVGDVLVSNQENYLELASLALSSDITGVLYPVGISEPQAEIRYRSYQQVPQAAALATGFITADLLQKAEANDLLPAGLTRSKVGSEDLSRSPTQLAIPAIAESLLLTLRRIACA